MNKIYSSKCTPFNPVRNTLQGAKIIDTDGAYHIDTDRGRLIFSHKQDCCETFDLVDCDGDLHDLVGGKIISIEVTDSDRAPENSGASSYTWSFLKIATTKGMVTLHFYGESNGCYNEDLDLYIQQCPTIGETR